MECLYCHKRLGFFASKKRPFCSELHEVAYQDEQQGLALRRVLDPLFTEPARRAPLQQGTPPGGSLGTTSRHQIPPAASLTSPPRADASEPPRIETPAQPSPEPLAPPEHSVSAHPKNGEIRTPPAPPPYGPFLRQLHPQAVALEHAAPSPLPAFEQPGSQLEFPHNGSLIEDTWEGFDRTTGEPLPERVEEPELPLQGLLAQFPLPAIRPEDLASPDRPLDFTLPVSSDVASQPFSLRPGETLSEPHVGVASRVALETISASEASAVAETVPPGFDTLSVEFEFPAIRALVRDVWKWAIAEPVQPLTLTESGLSISPQLPDPLRIREDPSRAIEGPDDLKPSTSPHLELLQTSNRATDLLREPGLALARPVALPPVPLVSGHLPVFEQSAAAIEFPRGQTLVAGITIDQEPMSEPNEDPLEALAVSYRISAVLPPAMIHSPELDPVAVMPAISLEAPTLRAAEYRDPSVEPGLQFARMIAGHPTPPTEGVLSAFRVPGTEVEFPRTGPQIAHTPYSIDAGLAEAPSISCRVHAETPLRAPGPTSSPEVDFPGSHPVIADPSYSIKTSLAEAPQVSCRVHPGIPSSAPGTAPNTQVDFSENRPAVADPSYSIRASLAGTRPVPCRVHGATPFEADSSLGEISLNRSAISPVEVAVAISRRSPAWNPTLRESPIFAALTDGATLLPGIRPDSIERESARGGPDGEPLAKLSAPALPPSRLFPAVVGVTYRGQPAPPKSWKARQAADPTRRDEPEPLDLPWRPASPSLSAAAFPARVEEGPAIPQLLPMRPVAAKTPDLSRNALRAKLLRAAGTNLRIPRLFFPFRESDLAACPLSVHAWTISSSASIDLSLTGLQLPAAETCLPSWEAEPIAVELHLAGKLREIWDSPAPLAGKSPVEGPCEFAYRTLIPVLQTRTFLAPKRILTTRKRNFEIRPQPRPDDTPGSYFADSFQLQPFRAASRIQIREPEAEKVHHYNHLPMGIHTFAWRSFPMVAEPHIHGAPLPLRRPVQTPPVR